MKRKVRFSLSNVRVLKAGELGLSVRYDGEKWTGSEVVSLDEFSYGLFTFRFSADLEDLPSNTVITFKLGRSQ